MNRLATTGLAIAVLTASQLFSRPCEAVAALIADDTFESYTTGTSVAGGAGGTGWSGAWGSAGGTPNIVSGVLSGLGQSLELAPADGTHSNNIVFRQFTPQTGTVYVGFVLQTGGSFDGNDFFQVFMDDDAAGELGDSGDAGNALSVAVLGSSEYRLRKGSGFSSGGGSQVTTGAPAHANETANQLVLKLSKSSGLATGNYDELELFVDGTSILSMDSTHAGNDLVGTTLSTFHVRLSSLESADRIYIDDVRIATTFAEAVPEPSSIILAACGVIAGIAVLRKRT